LKQRKSEINVVYVGRYNQGEILSGPEKTAKRIFTEHSKSCKTFFLQYFFDGRIFGKAKKLWGKNVLQADDNSIIVTAGIFKIYGLLKNISPDIVHIITFERFALIALIYAKLNGAKIIYNAHGIIEYENSVLKNVSLFYKIKDRFCEKMFLKKTDRVIFPSVNALDTAEKYYRIDEKKSVILPGGIDENFNLTSKNGKTHEILRAVYIYKNEMNTPGLELLSAALFKLYSELELFIISSESMELKLGNNIRMKWVKFMDSGELAEFYSDKDIFLSLNSYDTFSISTAEAMAVGLIPVITEETGINRYIENGFNGYIVKSGKPEMVSSVIDELTKMDASKRNMISGNAGMIYDSLSWEKVHNMYMELYREVME
jgi:glycosyltransferase involved in cell wall biosynthesis